VTKVFLLISFLALVMGILLSRDLMRSITKRIQAPGTVQVQRAAIGEHSLMVVGGAGRS